MKNDLIDEILEENKDLNFKDSNIEEIINFFVTINPDIKANKDFKKKLRARLVATIWYNKVNKNKSLMFYLTPIFSFAFLFVFWFYFLSETLFFTNENIYKPTLELESIQTEPIISDFNINKSTKSLDSNLINSDIKYENINENANKINTLTADDARIINNQITDLIWNNNNSLLKPALEVEPKVMFKSHTSNERLLVWDLFEEKCLEFKWIFAEINSKNVCIKNNITCFSEDFISWICSFMQKK